MRSGLSIAQSGSRCSRVGEWGLIVFIVRIIFFTLLTCGLASGAACSSREVPVRTWVSGDSSLTIGHGADAVVFEISGMGGFVELAKPRSLAKTPELMDITAWAELGCGRVLMSTSSIYGRPGIVLVDPARGRFSAIVKTRGKPGHFTEGTESFKLVTVIERPNAWIVTYAFWSTVERLADSTLIRKSVKKRRGCP